MSRPRGLGPNGHDWNEWGLAPNGHDWLRLQAGAGPSLASAKTALAMAQGIVTRAQNVVRNAQANENGLEWWAHDDVVALVPGLSRAVSAMCGGSTNAANAAAQAANLCPSAVGHAANARSRATTICSRAGCCGYVPQGDSCGISHETDSRGNVRATLNTQFYQCVVSMVTDMQYVVNEATRAMLACVPANFSAANAPGSAFPIAYQGPRPPIVRFGFGAVAGALIGIALI